MPKKANKSRTSATAESNADTGPARMDIDGEEQGSAPVAVSGVESGQLLKVKHKHTNILLAAEKPYRPWIVRDSSESHICYSHVPVVYVFCILVLACVGTFRVELLEAAEPDGHAIQRDALGRRVAPNSNNQQACEHCGNRLKRCRSLPHNLENHVGKLCHDCWKIYTGRKVAPAAAATAATTPGRKTTNKRKRADTTASAGSPLIGNKRLRSDPTPLPMFSYARSSYSQTI